VNCPRCHHDNRPAAKFCEQCATPLPRSCGGCGSPLPDGARFCPECAHPVPDPTAAAARAQPSPAAEQWGERRQATVLFADIAGYTALCASMDAEQVQALLHRFYELTDRTVDAYGGNVIDHAGDGVLAVFGAPVAHADDPERAVRAALDMQEAAAQLADATGRALRLHVGIAAGEVVAAVISGGAKPKYTITGDVVNLAARLVALAEAGETVVSRPVYGALSDIVDAQDLGEKPVKGFEAPARVYRVRALRPSIAQRMPFVGRHAELHQLSGVLDATRDAGTGMTVVLRGEPGIGKSRLTEELAWRAPTRGYACHVGRVLDFGVGKGQDALPVVCEQLLGVAGSADATARHMALDAALAAGIVAPEQEGMIRDVLDLEQREATQAIFDAMDNATRVRRTAAAVADLAGRAAHVRPLLLIFEDIHWGSPLLLACLAALAVAARECPLVLLMTTRFEGDPLDRQWRAASHGTPLLTIDLGPLRRDEALTLAQGMIQPSTRVAQDCIERAEGNPLFLAQLLRNAHESGSASIPPTVQSLVLARMDRLAPRDKLALQAASVIGKRFTLEALRALTEDERCLCDALVAADLVRPQGEHYLFAHALIQEGVYSSLLNSRKRELHRKAADWYCTTEPVLYAEHLDRAQDPAAARACLLAAQDQANRHRYDTALRLAERGLALAQELELRYALSMLRAELLRDLARTHDSIVAFQEALASAADDAQRCRAWIGIAVGHRITGELQPAMQALERAQPIAERLELWALASVIHVTRGNLHFGQGNIQACGEEHRRALDYARRAGDVACEVQALSGLGDHCYAQGRMRSALEYFERCLALCREHGLVRLEIPNRCMVGNCLAWLGVGDRALVDARAAVELADQVGPPQVAVMCLQSLSLTLVTRGDYEEAEPVIERAIAAARSAGARRYLSNNLTLMGWLRHAQGGREQAHALYAESLDLARQAGFGFMGPAILGLLAIASTDRAERQRLLQEGEAALLDGESLAHAVLMFYRAAIDVALAERAWDAALRYADAIDAFVRHEPLAWGMLVAERARALVALARHGPQPQVVAQLQDLRTRLRHAGLGSMTPEIDRALT
jgi:class 3 adenylate cyclase/tetratricopeptide (TPR) repeat protein